MSNKLNALREQIASTHIEIDAAERAYSKANADLVNGQGRDAMEAARSASTRLVNLRADLKLLEDAKGAFQREEASDETAQRKAAAVEHFKTIEAFVEQRDAIAKKMDEVLARFHDTVNEWVAVNEEMRGQVNLFSKKTVLDQRQRLDRFLGIGGELVKVPAIAVACQLDEACRGLNAHHHLAFQYSRRKHHSQKELVADDVQSSGERLLLTLRGIAFTEGVQL